MWRLCAWRLELEFWNFLAFLLQFPLFRQLRRFDRPVGYFAFGANLDPSVLARRGMRVLDEKELLLRDHVLLFNQPGPFEGFGFASVEAAPGRTVYGKVLTISRIDAIRMDFYEVLPYIHRHRRVWAEQDGARVFFYQTTHPQAGQIPSREYLDKILYSAERSPIIPPALLEELRNTPTLDVLRPRRSPHFLIDDYGSAPDWLVAWRRRYDMQGVRFFRFLYGLTFFTRWIRPELPAEAPATHSLAQPSFNQESSSAD